jgi:hypothetical protein
MASVVGVMGRAIILVLPFIHTMEFMLYMTHNGPQLKLTLQQTSSSSTSLSNNTVSQSLRDPHNENPSQVQPTATPASITVQSASSVANIATSSATKLPKDLVSRELLRKALEALEESERSIIKHLLTPTGDGINTILKNLVKYAEHKRTLCENKRWTFQWRGQTIELQKKASSVLEWLDRFKGVGDVVANADPVHIGLPWAGIRLFIEVRVLLPFQ